MKKLSDTIVPACVLLLLLEFYLFSQSIMLNPKKSSILTLMVHFFWLSTPLLFLFFVLRLVRFRPLLAFTVTSLIFISLNIISSRKALMTNEPLGFNDLTAGYNLVVALKYMPTISYLFIILAAIGLFFLYRFEKKQFSKESFKFSHLIILILLTPFAFYIYFQNFWQNNSPWYKKISELAEKYEITYVYWDWPSNLRLHGLPMHLVQTSSRAKLPTANKKEKQLYQSYSTNKTLLDQAPRTVIYILCESCWYDQQNFREAYQPLFDLGFSEARATSPVFGGGTANAEFEMLTGLPSYTRNLSGIIYQEYASYLRDKADTLPQNLRANGYITYAGHNDIPDFYHRNIVYTKFGFDEYQSINDMGKLPEFYAKQRKPWQWAPDDYLLFNTAIQRLKAAGGHKIFMHLLTMTTHGAYHQENENDDGSQAYLFLVKQSISRMKDFVKQVEVLDPNALIVIYGDHKPTLMPYFIRKNLLTPDDLNKGPARYGDVPVLVKAPNKEQLQSLIEQFNHKPFYCLTNAIDDKYIGIRPFSFKFLADQGCLKPGPYDYQTLTNSAPGWLYRVTMF